jgi:two-component system, NtrC family, response regulator AtoC
VALCLVVEDAPGQRNITELTLRGAGHEVLTCGSGAEAVALVTRHQPEILLLDLGLPDADGLDVIPRLLAVAPRARIVVLTGRDSARDAVTALHAGARHYLVKPWEREELLLVVAREARDAAAWEAAERQRGGETFWGDSPTVRRLQEMVGKLAASPLTPVLIEGETGSGKEVLARELHRATGSPGPFVALNCAAVPSELLESELFGHERGAFTGAETRRRGLVELASEGTLFLDEIGEMPLSLQPKLLRFLEGLHYRRVGGEDELESQCRVVAATHRDLQTRQVEGGFREDLYYRLAVVRLAVPPLRERQADLLPTARFLLDRLARTLGRRVRRLSPAAELAVQAYRWPGNVRELRNRLERALVLGEDGSIEPEDLDLARLCRRCGRVPCRCGEPATPVVSPAQADPAGADDEAARVLDALKAERWNVARAARRLGVERHWLKYRMAKHGLQRP